MRYSSCILGNRREVSTGIAVADVHELCYMQLYPASLRNFSLFKADSFSWRDSE